VKLFLVLRHHTGPIDDHADVVGHLAWMRVQHERGNVLISGPSSDGTIGIYVLHMAPREDAATLAASDPLAQGDRVRIEIIEWNVHQLFGIGSFDPPRTSPAAR